MLLANEAALKKQAFVFLELAEIHFQIQTIFYSANCIRSIVIPVAVAVHPPPKVPVLVAVVAVAALAAVEAAVVVAAEAPQAEEAVLRVVEVVAVATKFLEISDDY